MLKEPPGGNPYTCTAYKIYFFGIYIYVLRSTRYTSMRYMYVLQQTLVRIKLFTSIFQCRRYSSTVFSIEVWRKITASHLCKVQMKVWHKKFTRTVSQFFYFWVFQKYTLVDFLLLYTVENNISLLYYSVNSFCCTKTFYLRYIIEQEVVTSCC